jgi:hypothetical protein
MEKLPSTPLRSASLQIMHLTVVGKKVGIDFLKIVIMMSSHQRVRLMRFNEHKYMLGEKHWVVGNVFRILTSLGLGLDAAQEELGPDKDISLSNSKRLSLVSL